MFKYLSQLLILCSLLGQVVNVFGLPLAFTSNPDSVVSLQFKGCCTSKAKISCCGNDCICCFSNELPSDDFALVQENPVGQGIQVLWLNPVSTNKCKGNNLISQFGVDMAVQEMESMKLVLVCGSNLSTDVSSLSCGVKLSNFKPPRI
ncbi:MAG: hypothetical protein K2Q30_04880 [Gemmataceae bacterium]|nr:hypothetical protein [Gemmataceae bacterium]